MGRNNLPDTRRRRGAFLTIVAVVVIALALIPAAGLSVAALLGTKQPQAMSNPPQLTPQSQPAAPAEPGARVEPNQTPAQAMTPEAMPNAVVEPTPTLLPPWQGTGRLTLLLMGIDQRPKDDPDKTNTDTMIVLTLDPSTHTAGMLSIPRDLYVPLPNHGQDRINTAQAVGGPRYAMRAVESIIGIPIQHYVRVNFTAVTTLVDLVGGIDVYVDQDINDPTYPDMNYGFDPFVISKGWHHLDGVTALKYARTRHASNDIYRMRRQQQIIMALRDRALSTDAIGRLLPNAPLLLNTLSNSIATDLSPSEMLQLVLLAKDLPANKITRVVMDETAVKPWTTPHGAQVLLPVQARIRQLAAQLINPAPAAERIAIQNATQNPALAMTTQNYLQSMGYTVIIASDSGGAHHRSLIIDYRGHGERAQELASALGLPASAISTTVNTNSKLDALVILGDDFHLQPGTP